MHCIGRKISYLEQSVLLATVLQRHEMVFRDQSERLGGMRRSAFGLETSIEDVAEEFRGGMKETAVE